MQAAPLVAGARNASSQKPALRTMPSAETGCQRCAWSCPLWSERFEVEPQDPEAEVAGLGVAVILRNLLSDRTDEVRRLSSLSLPSVSPHWDSHAYRLCLAGLASCPVQREGGGAAHRSRWYVLPSVPFVRGSGRSPGAATSKGRRSPVRHGARVSIAAVRGRDGVGVCFGQLTRATRPPESCSAPIDPLPGSSPSPIRNKHIGTATLTPTRSSARAPATRA